MKQIKALDQNKKRFKVGDFVKILSIFPIKSLVGLPGKIISVGPNKTYSVLVKNQSSTLAAFEDEIKLIFRGMICRNRK